MKIMYFWVSYLQYHGDNAKLLFFYQLQIWSVDYMDKTRRLKC